MRLRVVEDQRHLCRTYICMFCINLVAEYPTFGLPILIQNALLPVFYILAHVHTRIIAGGAPESPGGKLPPICASSFPSTGPIRGQRFTANFHVWGNDAAEFCMRFFRIPTIAARCRRLNLPALGDPSVGGVCCSIRGKWEEVQLGAATTTAANGQPL